MATEARPFLSIVVPFHDSADKCGPLLTTLAKLRPGDDTEIILVDDGSTDTTSDLLRQFASSASVRVMLIKRDHGGPGAARNSGLDRASGRYIWFVDSDDDIDLGAIALARDSGWTDSDMIAWDWDHPTIRRGLAPGFHAFSTEPLPPDVLDPIVANWFSADFFRRNAIRFPENCLFEATPLEAFVLPLLVESIFRSERIAYRANTDCPSVTRSPALFPNGYFDRLRTVSLGMDYVRRARLDPADRAPFERAFVRLFLWYSIKLSRRPGPSWLIAMRVMRQFRDEARRFGIRIDPLSLYPGRSASRLAMRLLWRLSAALPDQRRYFDDLHRRAWPKPLSWDQPAAPKPVRPGPRPASERESFPAAPDRP